MGFFNLSLMQDVLYAIMGAVRPPQPNMCTGSLSADGPSSDGQGTESTEEALTQTRSRWQMSRTVVSIYFALLSILEVPKRHCFVLSWDDKKHIL
jgi:hypothetical protein